MKTYLVGGAVRDQLLGLPVHERDWLVTGASAQDLLGLDYRRVGREFPVFLHPETAEEYALPRYGTLQADEQEQIEADLVRRDLTINAMAMGADGKLFDPLSGQRDLELRLLRHTPSFSDDPIRVLRLARFAARYAGLGFRIADETVALVQQMVDENHLKALVPERVWSEIFRALNGENPRRFFEALRDCHALKCILPELDRLFGVPQPEAHHPEIDTGLHTLMVLDQACLLSSDSEVRFAALLHDLGKGTTPPENWPRHIGHEKRSGRLVKAICQRLRIPNRFRDIARLVAENHTNCHKVLELKPGTLLKILMALGALNRPERLEQFLLACEADSRGRSGFEHQPYPQADFFRAACKAAAAVDTAALARHTEDKSKLPDVIAQQRVKAIAGMKLDWPVT